MKKVWQSPIVQNLGDVQSLTQQSGNGNQCPPPSMKGQGTGDTLNASQANSNTGCNLADGASGFN